MGLGQWMRQEMHYPALALVVTSGNVVLARRSVVHQKYNPLMNFLCLVLITARIVAPALIQTTNFRAVQTADSGRMEMPVVTLIHRLIMVGNSAMMQAPYACGRVGTNH